jgi:hypothetical protein
MPTLAPSVTVGLLSAAILACETLLVRVFAIEHFQHFAYMAIGVAMLGFGASGTLLALRRGSGPPDARWGVLAALLAPWALLAGPALAHRVALDPTQLLWDGGQWFRLGAVYLALAVPLGITSLAILVFLTRESGRVGQIYGASFLGSGLGAAGSVGLLGVLPPAHALATPAVLAALGGLAATSGRRAGIASRLTAVAAIVAALTATARPPWTLQVSAYKGLPQVEAFPDARRVAERSGPLGWTVAVEAPSFHYAPGLSLAYRGRLPHQRALFVDGETVGATADRCDTAMNALVRWLPSALPYALGGRERVLVLGAVGDVEVRSARVHGARHVVAVQPDLHVVGLSRTGAPDTAITWEVDDLRSFVARTHERFDLVTLGLGGAIGGSAAGVHALSEDFTHTVEAFTGYLRCLGADGVLAATCWLSVPPRESVRLILTAAEAARRVRPGPLSRAIVVSRSWGTVTVLVKPSGFGPGELQALRDWAAAREFEIDWPREEGPRAARSPGGVFAAAEDSVPAQGAVNVLDDRALFGAIRAALAGPDSAARFAKAYAFSVAPAPDVRPFPQHYLRAASLARMGRGEPGRWLPFAEWGYLALIATLAQSALLAGFLMLLPAALRHGVRPGARYWVTVAYFAAIGLGYMATELAAIPPLSLVLGHPVYAVALVLATLLVFSGLGSLWSDRLPPERRRRVGVILALVLAAGSASLIPLAHVLGFAALPVRALVVLAALAPPGILMGMPFPLGLRALAHDADGVAWAWASNGFASVVAAPLAALVALEAGTTTLLLLGAASYAVAAALPHTEAVPQ